MSVHISKYENITNVRNARIYIKYLDLDISRDQLNKNNLDKYNQEINKALNKNRGTPEINELIEKANNFCSAQLLPIEKFDWIKDDRTCFYVWGRVRTLDADLFTPTKTPSWLARLNSTTEKNNKSPFTYDELELNKNPSNHQERLDLIIELIDLIDFDLQRKTKILDDIKSDWNIIFNNKKPFNWLDEKNEELCEWTWNYVKKHSDFCDYLSPTNNHERYLSIYAAFDLWNTNTDTKKLFLININKAHSQQKFRAGIKNKKAINTFIDEKSKKRLDDLSKRKGMKINQLIEYLIDEEFKKPESNSR